MKILDLVLKHKWYDMYLSGEKSEEYRDITPYWFRRLIDFDPELYHNGNPIPLYFEHDSFDTAFVISWDLNASGVLSFKDYTHVRFHRGYTNTTMMFPINKITIDVGNLAWGAPKNRNVFIIKLGEICTLN